MHACITEHAILGEHLVRKQSMQRMQTRRVQVCSNFNITELAAHMRLLMSTDLSHFVFRFSYAIYCHEPTNLGPNKSPVESAVIDALNWRRLLTSSCMI
jgi:hypothetical protein